MRRTISVLLSLFVLFNVGFPARAQSAAQASLYDLKTNSFPVLSAGLDVFDSAGSFVSGLKPGGVTLLEDNQPRPLDSLEELQPGVQFALALDPGPAFVSQGVDAVNRFQKIVNIVQAWAAAHPDALGDDLSLVPTGGTPSRHQTSTAAFSEALTAYQPNLRTLAPSLTTLSLALDVVSEPAAQPGMKRAVLYVTSVPAAEDIQAVQSLTQRAVEQNVRVYVWIVASPEYFKQAGATALKDLAIQTGGQYAPFSGEDPLPDPEEYLAPLRRAYHLTYTSAIVTPGNHSLVLQANLNGETVSSEPLAFDLDVQPPNPMLVSPPEQIVRQGVDPRDTDIAAFPPTSQPIQILVEFPDRHLRPLVRTTLFVDGQKVAENTAEPFDTFTWDIAAYTVSGEHQLQVEALDSLGLNKVSLSVPVTVTVVQPERGLLPFLRRNSLWVVLGAVLLAGAILGVILAWGRIKRVPRPNKRISNRDPLTQPVEADAGRRGLRLRKKGAEKQSDAYLVRLKEDGQSVTAPPIPVIAPEMTFGSDPLQATRILDDPSISPLHARLTQAADGAFTLSDEKTASGTWVNYEPLAAPRILQHGDILHIGRLSYRFMLHRPPEQPAPQVIPIKQ